GGGPRLGAAGPDPAERAERLLRQLAEREQRPAHVARREPERVDPDPVLAGFLAELGDAVAVVGAIAAVADRDDHPAQRGALARRPGLLEQPDRAVERIEQRRLGCAA